MSYHWDGANPIPTSARLKAFLGSHWHREEFMDGSYVQMDEDGNVSCDVFTAVRPPGGGAPSCLAWCVAPNPSRGQVRIDCLRDLSVAKVQWFDAMGRALENGGVVRTCSAGRFGPVAAWGTGVRYVTVTTKDGWSTTRKVVVQ